MSKMQALERASGELQDAKAALAEASQPLRARTREGAAAADEYVRARPWSAVGFAIAAGALVGFLAGSATRRTTSGSDPDL